MKASGECPTDSCGNGYFIKEGIDAKGNIVDRVKCLEYSIKKICPNCKQYFKIKNNPFSRNVVYIMLKNGGE